ncbi:alpha/beta fold hydrolase [Afifella pfennigii]|uniref:alpha/beta fold hydrolase n=1 Tax=Afifella pfennigii TaxID=209897 RepID=UPI00047CCA09|nr:alpha/beta hydrolase [Afifella pfennigii]
MPTFEASDGVRLRFEDRGEGPPILLIHGFASNRRVNWDETSWIEALSEAGFRVLVPDLRGHGESDKPRETSSYAMRRMAQDQFELLDHLRLNRIVAMGYSLGGRIAAHMAVFHPERIAALIIGGLGDQLTKGLPQADAIAAGLRAPKAAEVEHPLAAGFRAFAERTGADLEALAACMEAGRANLTPAQLAGLDMPVLIAVGEEDEVAGDPQNLAEMIQGAELALIARRDHMKAVGDKAHKAAVLSFLERLGHG